MEVAPCLLGGKAMRACSRVDARVHMTFDVHVAGTCVRNIVFSQVGCFMLRQLLGTVRRGMARHGSTLKASWTCVCGLTG